MAQLHLVRVSALGQVGRFASVDAVRYPRGSRVIVRSARGLETAEVVGAEPAEGPWRLSDGPILRGMTDEDLLLEARLARDREKAFQACAARVAELGLSATLVDVEPLFDGRTVVFYFLGETTPELDAALAELAEAFEAKAQFRRFAQALSAGCGPGCGTAGAAGGCHECSTSCALSQACTVRRGT